ncbi:MAG: signal peptidase I [bacterium]|nr:signal peptidase I [bacterium]
MEEQQQSDGPVRKESALRNLFSSIWGLAKVFIISALIILPIRTYIAQPFFVRGESMVPNFHDGEYLVIDELSYNLGIRSPKRGDVVVFRYPKDPSQFYIKRIIGLPGERVTISEDKIVVINNEYPKGLQLNEGQYLPTTDITVGNIDSMLGKDEYFVLGDNREHSSDSRFWGAVPRNLIVGRAWLRLFPINEASAFATPQYGGIVPSQATVSPQS